MNDQNSKPHRILVADDVASMAGLIEHLLSRQGYKVATVEDGAQCLEKVQTFSPSLIILDLILPKVHGMEVLRRLKSDPKTAGIGVIMCTAKQFKPDQDQALELGAFAVLLKPFNKEELFELVRRFYEGLASTKTTKGTEKVGEEYIPSIDKDVSFFHLWGTRGSTPVSGQRYVRHGGNTSCLEVGKGNESIIVDAGTGIRDLGNELVHKGPRKVHILITHTHWDHIQGFPFFAPAYIPGFEIVVYGVPTFKKDLKSVFTGQLDRDYFPVQFGDMQAKIEFCLLEEPPLRLGKFDIYWEYTHHPAATVGYKFVMEGKSLAYVSDNEFLYGYLGDPGAIALDSTLLTPYQRLVDFLQNVNVLIAEAQYTNEEYRTKIGWGHSSLSNACALASMARVKRWVVSHHDPTHSDDFLAEKLNLNRAIMRRLNHSIEVVDAYDGMKEYW